MSRWVDHTPEWVPAYLAYNTTGDTRSGWVCVHQLENGNGPGLGNVFDLTNADGPHSCIVYDTPTCPVCDGGDPALCYMGHQPKRARPQRGPSRRRAARKLDRWERWGDRYPSDHIVAPHGWERAWNRYARITNARGGQLLDSRWQAIR